MFLLTGTLSCLAQEAALSPAKVKLLALQKERFAALSHKDTTALSRLLADDLVYIHTNGVVDNKSSLLKGVANGSVDYQFIYPEKMTANIDGDFGWVYGNANIRFRVASINMIIDQYISFMDFYRYSHNQWLLVACQNARVNKDNPYFVKPPTPQAKENVQPSIY